MLNVQLQVQQLASVGALQGGFPGGLVGGLPGIPAAAGNLSMTKTHQSSLRLLKMHQPNM